MIRKKIGQILFNFDDHDKKKKKNYKTIREIFFF